MNWHTHVNTHILASKFILSTKSCKRRNFPNQKKKITNKKKSTSFSQHIRCAPAWSRSPLDHNLPRVIYYFITQVFISILFVAQHFQSFGTSTTTTATSKPIAKLFNKLLLDRPAVTVYLCCGNCYSNFIC